MRHIKTLEWDGDALKMVDQTQLPSQLVYEKIDTCEGVYDAIRQLKVRGAPAIGDAAAFGLYLGVMRYPDDGSVEELLLQVEKTAEYLAASRPTAVNLFWALDRMRAHAKKVAGRGGAREIKKALLAEAQAIREEDVRTCRLIGENGFPVLEPFGRILTHCNAGGLATAEYGTALAPIYVGIERGKKFEVYADETRPLLQGSRITAFELRQADIPVTVLCDNTAAWAMAKGLIDAVIVGADRIAANGDAANKIGTYGVALAAHAHKIPFYVAAPISTFDFELETGSAIPIEERAGAEVTHGFGRQTAPDGVAVYNPAFDVTPAKLIRAIITEKGVVEAPDSAKVKALAK
ncbi:MAG: S-methyl-5-thioribose-1-phosphate isomerase [Chitinivibrionales bacterium]|nr:S-methyl-5-thioribose-1-phosphate isomerase [Chitinivibrionales bacterium]MBD3357151.1 S-methyl-5-thioribose-1-phosphate isomerase [Chitinivibrionales bacterium]